MNPSDTTKEKPSVDNSNDHGIRSTKTEPTLDLSGDDNKCPVGNHELPGADGLKRECTSHHDVGQLSSDSEPELGCEEEEEEEDTENATDPEYGADDDTENENEWDEDEDSEDEYSHYPPPSDDEGVFHFEVS